METAHHRTTFWIFCNITQNTTPEENNQKMFHISSPIVLFSWEDHGYFGGESGSNFIWGGQKEGVRGVWGEAQIEVVFFAKFPLLSKIQTLSYKLFIWQTSNHHHCDRYAQKPTGKDFQVFSAVHEAVHSDVSQLWAICMHYLGNCSSQEYAETLLKILHLKKTARKCSLFLHQLCFFLMGRSRIFFGDMDQISSGEGKRKG